MSTDALEFLQSRPLIGYQMDGSHLNHVLQDIIRQQQQLANNQQQIMQRLTNTEEDIKEIASHVREVERVTADVGGLERLSEIRGRLDAVERGMDVLSKNIEDTHKIATTAATDADQAGRLADEAHRGLVPVRKAVDQLLHDVDSFGRQNAAEQREIERALEELQSSRTAQERSIQGALRELHSQAERLERDSGVERIRQMLEELSDRTDENFKSVEESARVVDEELSRQSAELKAIRVEVGAVDERVYGRMVSFAAEMEEKHKTLLSAFRDYERNASELEEHLVMAGKALARRREQNGLIGRR